MKTLRFIGSSQDDLAAFPEPAKRSAGFELWQVQLGLMPSDFKPMPTVGAGAYEVRVKIGTQWRVIYVATKGDAVYVFTPSRRPPGRRPSVTLTWRPAATS